MVKLENVVKKYKTGKVSIKALDRISLEIKQGELVLFTGPSGSGKTTLLNIIGCLTRVTSGRVLLWEEEISHFPDHFLSAIRRDKIGFIFQQFNLISGYRTWENVSFPLIPMGVSERLRRMRAMKLLEELNLETRADFMANELSGGEQQRAAIARALINDPEIILADESLSNIDLSHVRMVIEIITKLKRKGRTVIASFHDAPPDVAKMADRTFDFNSGRMSPEF